MVERSPHTPSEPVVPGDDASSGLGRFGLSLRPLPLPSASEPSGNGRAVGSLAVDDPAHDGPILPAVDPRTAGRLVRDHQQIPGLRGLPAHPFDEGRPRFVRPVLLPAAAPTTALLIGRMLMVIAALIVGIAARRPVGRRGDGDVLWLVAPAAGVLVVVGLVAVALWSAHFAENGRRLRARVSAPDVAGWTWAIPALWVAFASSTFLRLEPGGDFDPLPVLAGIGFAIALAVPVSRTQRTFRGMTHRPPSLWVTVYVLDLVGFGAIWWRLTSWPDPITDAQLEHVEATSVIVLSCAGVLAASGLVYAWLALRAVQSTYERLARVEARHRPRREGGPSWFHSGFRPDRAPTAAESRPLVDLAPLSSAVAIGHVVMGIVLVAWSVLIVRIGTEAGGLSLGGAVRLDAADLDRLSVLSTLVLVMLALSVVVHGAWSFLAGLDAHRATVHAAHPLSFAAPFVPAPILIVAGLLVDGTVGDVVLVAGVLASCVAIVRLNLMLITLSAHLGGKVRGFGRWTWMIAITYLIALIERFLVAPSTGRLGLLAVVAVVQGALVIAGGLTGRSAMRSLEQTLVEHPQLRRAGPIRSALGA